MDQLIIIKRQFKLINQQVVDNFPHETGGFFGGKDNLILGVCPIANINSGEKAKNNFSMTEDDIYYAQSFFKANGMQIMGMYHSHPNGAPMPSAKDMTHLVGDKFGRHHLIVAIKEHTTMRKKFRVHKEEPAFQIRLGLYYCPSHLQKITRKLKIIEDSHIKSYLATSGSQSSKQNNNFYQEYMNLEEKIFQMVKKGKIDYKKEEAGQFSRSNFNIDA